MHMTRRLVTQFSGVMVGAVVWRSVFAASNASLRLAYFNNYAPLSMEIEGKMKGVYIDVFDEVLGKRMGLTLEHAGYPWARAQQLVRDGQSDALCTIPTPARLEYLTASNEAIVNNTMRLFVRKDHPRKEQFFKAATLEQIRQLKPSMITYLGNGWTSTNFPNYPGMQTATNMDTAMRMLLAGRVDAMVDASINILNWLKEHEFTEGQFRLFPADIEMGPITFENTRYCLLIPKDSPHVTLLPEFDKQMAKFRKEEGYKKILRQYGL